MHVHFLDPYQELDSPVHRLDARIKLILAVTFIFTVALTPFGAWPVYFLLTAFIFSVEILSASGIGYYLKRALLAAPFVLAAVPLLFTVPGTHIFSISTGFLTLNMSVQGLTRFVSILLKSWISVQAALVLITTTQFPDLLRAMRALHLPKLLVAIIGLMWRYLFVLVDEAMRLMRARTARSGESEKPGLKTGGNVAWRARVTGGMAGSLFLRSIERSDRIYMAMLARGYDGEVRSRPLAGISLQSWILLTVSLLFFVLMLLLGTIFTG